MVDRRLVFGDPADAGTRWAMDDAAGSTGGGNFVLARDLDGGGVLLRYNPTSGNFEPFAPVDLGGEDILDGSTTVYDAATDTVGDGTTSANHESVNTEKQNIGDSYFVAVGDSVSQSPVKIIESPLTTTSTNWATFSNQDQKLHLPTQVLSSDAEIRIAWAGVIKNDTDNETTKARLRYQNVELPKTEVSHTGNGFSRVQSALSDPIDPTLSNFELKFQMQVTGGSGMIEEGSSAIVVIDL